MDNLPYERARNDSNSSEQSELFPISPVNSQDTNLPTSLDTPPASPASEGSNLHLLRKLNTLEIICVIGSGSFGTVIEVKHEDERRLAIKCIPLGTDKDVNNEKRQEARFLASFRHINVVRYDDSWIDDYRIEEIPHAENKDYNENRLDHYVQLGVRGNSRVSSPRVSGQSSLHLCLQMELCKTNLEQMIKNQLYRQTTRAWNIIWQIVKGMAYLHGEHMIHGDLHTANILLDESDCVKIADFGLSIRMSSSSDIGFYTQERDVYDMGVVFAQVFGLSSMITGQNQTCNSPDLVEKEIVQSKCAIEYHIKSSDLVRWLLNPPETRPTCAQLLEYRKSLDQVPGDHIYGNRYVNQYKPIHTDAFCNKNSKTKLDNPFSTSV